MENQSLVREICPTTTQEWVKNGATLVDVREINEISQLSFDVPNIFHIPLSEFEDRYKELPIDKDLVMVCISGTRSLRAAGFLINHGYTKVVNMQFGMDRWALKGFPTKGENKVISENDSCCSSTSCC
jgi:rhodanese-related sulfurtransferase